jgi:hypothetical protein
MIKRPKRWTVSRTIQLHAANALQALIVLAVEFLSTHPNATLTRAELINLLVSAATIVLRVFTDQPIAGGPKDPTLPGGGTA